METVVEQFIGSDKPKSTSKIFQTVAIALLVIGIILMKASLILFILVEVLALGSFIGSYFMYIDYEYEMFEGNITVTKIYNASRRTIAQKIEKDYVRKVYITQKEDVSKKGVKSYYNSNMDELEIYTFELKDNKIIQLALNYEMAKYVKIFYKEAMQFGGTY